MTIEDVLRPPQFVELRNQTNEKLTISVLVKAAPKAQRHAKQITLEPEKGRAFRVDSLGGKQVKQLERAKGVSLRPVAFVRLPSRTSYGYDEGVYICDECGGPIVFRGSPPVPIHV